MKNVIRMASVAVVAVVLAGCTTSSRLEPSASGTGSGTTGLAVTSAPTPTLTPTAGVSPRPTGVPRSSPPEKPRPSAPRLLTPQGLGGVPVGARLGAFAEALGGSATPMSATDRSVFADHSCVIRALNRPRGVGFMVIGEDPQGQVRRISILDGSDIGTDRGIALGSSMDAVRAAYGTGLDEPFDHFPVGGDSVLVRAGANLYLVFIGDDLDRVVELRLGFKPEVLSSEGCV